MVLSHLVALLIATVIFSIPVERAKAWMPLKTSFPFEQLPTAMLESQWGTPYVEVAGTVSTDGSIIFSFTGI